MPKTFLIFIKMFGFKAAFSYLYKFYSLLFKIYVFGYRITFTPLEHLKKITQDENR